MQLKIERLKQVHPSYTFIAGDTFRWSPVDKIIEYNTHEFDESGYQLLIHEIGHAELGHTRFNTDLDLIRKEVAAWQYVSQNSSQYEVTFEENLAERCLDSYRSWLDQRSCCPNCSATGYQPSPDMYQCINCTNSWNVSSDQQTRVCRRNINSLALA